MVSVLSLVTTMKCIDLFASCGGLSLGFMKAGVDVLAAVDNWEEAVKLYRKNFKHECYSHDLSDEEGTIAILINTCLT